MSRFDLPVDFPPGIVSDDTTFSAEGRWADGSNVRFFEGKPQVVGGWTLVKTLPAGTECVAMRVVYEFFDARAPGMFYATQSKFYSQDDLLAIDPDDATPVGLGTGFKFWSLEPFGKSLMVNPSGGPLYYYSTLGGLPTIVSQAPAQITRTLVTNERQVLALGCNEELSGTFNGECIRGSDIDGNYTDWTTSAANNAFEHILDGGGQIVGAEKIGAYVAVWTAGALYMGQFIGDPGQAYRFDRVSEGCGLAGPGAVKVVNGVAYWVSPDFNFFRWAPGTIPQDIPCPISSDFKGNITLGSADRITLNYVAKYKELWVHYPDSRDGNPTKCTRYIALSLADATWFRGNIGRGAFISADEAATAKLGAGVYLSSDGLNIYRQEKGNTADGGALNWFIQSADQYLSDASTRVAVQGVSPDFKDQVGSVSLTAFVRQRPLSAPVTKGPYVIAAASDKADFRFSGMIAAVKFSGGASTGSYVRFGKPVFHCVTEGGR